MNTKIIEIEDYISNSPEAKNLITDFSSIKFIEKWSCGLGGTSTVLSITDQNIIIVSPLIGMIKAKENIRQDHQLFIYKNENRNMNVVQTKDTWSMVEKLLSEGKNFIVNTTPNQIVLLKKNKPFLFEKIRRIPVFVDESHMAAEQDYRRELADFMNILFNEWYTNYTLSTATPCHKMMDVPLDVWNKMESYCIKRQNEKKKPITICPYNQYTTKIMEEVGRGKKVILFTNDLKVMKKIVTIEGISTQFLVGDTLDTKIQTIREFTPEEIERMGNAILADDIDVSILSTKYLTGYDINFEASIFILCKFHHKNKVENRTVNDIVQAYGRMRKNVETAYLFYDNSSYKETNNINYFENAFKEALLNPKPEQETNGIVNHTLVLNKHLPSIEKLKTFSDVETLLNNLTSKGFTANIDLNEVQAEVGSRITIADKIQYLLNLEVETLRFHTDKVFNAINGDSDLFRGFGKEYLTLFAAAFIIKLMKNDWLLESSKKATQYDVLVKVHKIFIDVNRKEESMSRFDKFIKVRAPQKAIDIAINNNAITPLYSITNDTTFLKAVKVINTLYTLDMVNKNKIDELDKQMLELNERVSKHVKQDFVTFLCTKMDKDVASILSMIEANDITLNTFIATLKVKESLYKTLRSVVSSLSFKPTEEQVEYAKIRIDAHLNTLSKYDLLRGGHFDIRNKMRHIIGDIQTQKYRHKIFLLGMLSIEIAGHTFGFKKTLKDNREYNFATKCPSYLRKYTPYQTTEIDIISANPQFIDKELGTSVAFEVYNNLMRVHQCTRRRAKIIFNSTINNQELDDQKKIKVFRAAGYSDEAAQQLALLTSERKIYYTMTKKEKQIMDFYALFAGLINPVRVHDGFIISNHNNEISSLPSEVQGIKFDIKKT